MKVKVKNVIIQIDCPKVYWFRLKTNFVGWCTITFCPELKTKAPFVEGGHFAPKTFFAVGVPRFKNLQKVWFYVRYTPSY